MKEPDYINLQQWVNEIRFFCDRIEDMLREPIKRQQEELHKYSETGKEYMGEK